MKGLKSRNSTLEEMHQEYLNGSPTDVLTKQLDNVIGRSRLGFLGENETLKASILELQEKASLSDAYKCKLESTIHYKTQYHSLCEEVEDLKSELYNTQVELNSHLNFKKLYSATSEELEKLKEEITKMEIDLEESNCVGKNLRQEVGILEKRNHMQDRLIKEYSGKIDR